MAYLSSLHLAVIGMFISATALDIILKNNKNPLKRKISDADQDPSECPDPATHNLRYIKLINSLFYTDLIFFEKTGLL